MEGTTTTTLNQALEAIDSMYDALHEYVLGYDVCGDGYLHDCDLDGFRNLGDLLETDTYIGSPERKAQHERYIDNRYPGARERYASIKNLEDIKTLERLSEGLSALLPREPYVPSISADQLQEAIPALLGETARDDATCVARLRDLVFSEPTTPGRSSKQGRKALLPSDTRKTNVC